MPYKAGYFAYNGTINTKNGLNHNKFESTIEQRG